MERGISGAFLFPAPSVTSWELCLSAALARCPVVSGNSSPKADSCASFPTWVPVIHTPLTRIASIQQSEMETKQSVKSTAPMPALSVLLWNLNYRNLNTASGTTSKSTQWRRKPISTQKKPPKNWWNVLSPQSPRSSLKIITELSTLQQWEESTTWIIQCYRVLC